MLKVAALISTLLKLMTEVSGDRWVKHMLYGTSRILQSSGSLSLSGRLERQLFTAFKMLEANRAILYGEDTFLSQELWLRRQQSLEGNSTRSMDIMFALMLRISSFNKL